MENIENIPIDYEDSSFKLKEDKPGILFENNLVGEKFARSILRKPSDKEKKKIKEFVKFNSLKKAKEREENFMSFASIYDITPKRLANRLQSDKTKYSEHSLFFFSRQNKLRQRLFTFIQSKPFILSYFFVILTHLLTIISLNQFEVSLPTIDRVNGAFAVPYVLEMFVRAVALGSWRGEDSLLRNKWVWIDILYLLGLALTNYSTSAWFRLLVNIKPMVLINLLPPVKELFNLLLASLVKIKGIAIFLTIIFFYFSIIGMTLWQGSLTYTCTTQPEPSAGTLIPAPLRAKGMHCGGNFYCSSEEYCVSLAEFYDKGTYFISPDQDIFAFQKDIINNRGETNFNTLPRSFQSLLQVVTLKRWVDTAMIFQHSLAFLPSTAYYFFFTLICKFFVLNFIIGVMIQTYSEEKENAVKKTKEERQQLEQEKTDKKSKYEYFLLFKAKQEVKRSVLKDIVDFIKKIKLFTKIRPVSAYHRKNRIALWLFKIVNQPIFNLVIDLAIFLNLVALSSERAGQPEQEKEYLQNVNIVFVFIFAAECAIKVIAFGFKSYFQSHDNVFDTVIVTVSVVEVTFFSNNSSFSTLRAFRAFRLFRFLIKFKQIEMNLICMAKALRNIGNYIVLMLILLAFFSIIGTETLRNDGSQFESWMIKKLNYDTFTGSLISTFTVFVGDGWPLIYYRYSLTDKGGFIIFFFVLQLVVMHIVCLNLFIAFFVSSFKESRDAYFEKDLQRLIMRENKNNSLRRSNSFQEDASNIRKKMEIKTRNSNKIKKRQNRIGCGTNVLRLNKVKVSNKRLVNSSFSFFESFAELKESLSISFSPDDSIKRSFFVFNQNSDFARTCAKLRTNSTFKVIFKGAALINCLILLLLTKTFYKETAILVVFKLIFTFSFILFIAEIFVKSIPHGFAFEKTETEEQRQKSKKIEFKMVSDPNQEEYGTSVVKHNNFFSPQVNKILSAIKRDDKRRKSILPTDKQSTNLKIETLKQASGVSNVADKCKRIEQIRKKRVEMFNEERIKDKQGKPYLHRLRNKFDFILTLLLGILLPFLIATDETGVSIPVWILLVTAPLHILVKFKKVNRFLKLIASSIPSLLNVFLMIILIFVVFSIFATNFFIEQVGTCSGELIFEKNACETEGFTWNTKIFDFNDIFSSLLVFFEMMTTDNWAYYMVETVEGRSGIFIAFFILFMIIGSLILMNIFVSVVIDTFIDLTEKERGILFLSDKQKDWIAMINEFLRYKPEIRISACGANPLRKKVIMYLKEQGEFVDLLIFIFLVIEACFFASAIFMGFDQMEMFQVYTIQVGSGLFLFEFGLKVISMQKLYFRSQKNIFELVCLINHLIASIIIFTNEDFKFTSIPFKIAKILASIRLLQLLLANNDCKKIVDNIIWLIPSLLEILLIMLTSVVAFSALGISLFAKVQQDGEILSSKLNFENFRGVTNIMLRCITLDGCTSVVRQLSLAPPNCIGYQTDEDYILRGPMQCGSYARAYSFFLVFIAVNSFMLMNMFLAIVVNNFLEFTNDIPIYDENLDTFYQIWSKYDKLNKSTILPHQAVMLAVELFKPMGLYSKKLAGKLSKIRKLRHVAPVYFSYDNRLSLDLLDCFKLSRRINLRLQSNLRVHLVDMIKYLAMNAVSGENTRNLEIEHMEFAKNFNRRLKSFNSTWEEGSAANTTLKRHFAKNIIGRMAQLWKLKGRKRRSVNTVRVRMKSSKKTVTVSV